MDNNLEGIIAEALCGSSRRRILHPCTYHVAQAKLALNALAGAGMVVVPWNGSEHKRIVERLHVMFKPTYADALAQQLGVAVKAE